MKTIQILILISIFFFTGCSFKNQPFQKSQTWEEMFDSKEFIPVNKTNLNNKRAI